MRKLIYGAAILLLAQLVLAAVTQIGGKTDMSATPEAPFLKIKADKVSSLEIFGPNNNKVVLEKNNGTWILPGTANAPADSQQVTALIDKLAGLKQGFVVAGSKEAANRFKVADDTYERHLLVKEDNTVTGDFFVGTSPAFRQVHARKAGSTDIVVVGLSTYELETSADKWLDKGLLRVADKDLAAIDFPDFSLTRKKEKEKTGAETWQLAKPDDTTLDAKVAEELADAITGLTVESVIDQKESGKIALDTPEFSFTVHTVSGTTLKFTFAKIDDNTFAVKRSDKDLVCKVAKATVEHLKQYNLDKLLGKQPVPKPPVAAQDTAAETPPLPDAPGTAAAPTAPADSSSGN